jgi:hypothetical protein
MIWNAPAALVGLLLLALPILVHFLVRRHATRVAFPAMRFVPSVRAAAVRLQAPADRLLLLLRLGVVSAAVLAAAQPVVVTTARLRAWEARIARAVIVDTSASVESTIAGERAAREEQNAFVTRRFAAADLREALGRASQWLASTTISRREVVVVSDFQIGAIGKADLATLPATVGVRLVRTNPPAPAGTPPTAVDGWRRAGWAPSLRLDGDATRIMWERVPSTVVSLNVRAPAADLPAAERAASAARSLGVPRTQPQRRIEVAFAGTPADRDGPPRTPWIAGAAIALANDPHTSTMAPVTIGERDGVLVARTTLPAGSALSPALIHAVLTAAMPQLAARELEPRAADEATLATWSRPAIPSGHEVPPDATDGRWLWAVALLLLAAEGFVRSRGERRKPLEIHADAA